MYINLLLEQLLINLFACHSISFGHNTLGAECKILFLLENIPFLLTKVKYEP